jgi:hypothetical protein
MTTTRDTSSRNQFDPLENALIMVEMAREIAVEAYALAHGPGASTRRAATLYKAAANGYSQAAYLTENGPGHIHDPAAKAAAEVRVLADRYAAQI